MGMTSYDRCENYYYMRVKLACVDVAPEALALSLIHIQMCIRDRSFINHIPIGGYTDFDVTEDKKGGNGVLGLLNQYYKKSDVGR